MWKHTRVSSQVHETTRLHAAPAVVKTRVEHPTSATCPPQNLFPYRTSTWSKSGNLHSQPVSYIQVSGNKTKDLNSSNIICHRYQNRSIIYFSPFELYKFQVTTQKKIYSSNIICNRYQTRSISFFSLFKLYKFQVTKHKKIYSSNIICHRYQNRSIIYFSPFELYKFQVTKQKKYIAQILVAIDIKHDLYHFVFTLQAI